MRKLYQEAINNYQILTKCQPLSNLCQISPLSPSGFNENTVELVTYRGGVTDLSSAIALALGSNLYLQGLTFLDYMSLQLNL